MALFQHGKFQLHSGSPSEFKIECDELTGEDWDTIAWIIEKSHTPFKAVHGVPMGGLPLANRLNAQIMGDESEDLDRLIVDDVCTSGSSLEAMRERLITMYPDDADRIRGIVVFSRNPWTLPPWCHALFSMNIDTHL